MAANIFICTLLMWGLAAIVVIPLAQVLFRNSLQSRPDLMADGEAALITEEAREEYRKLYYTKFIQADVLVMSIAGMIAGFAGFPLIGFAWKAKAWPGLLALIGASFLAFYIKRSAHVF